MGEGGVTRASIKDIVFSALRFVVAAGSGLWLSVLLPALAGAAGLYVSFVLYLRELERYIRSPSETTGYFVLVWVVVGFVAVLFAQTVIAAEVACRYLGCEDGGWPLFRLTRRVWRLFGGYLRFALVCAAYVGLILMLRFLIGELAAIPLLAPAAAVVLLGGLFVLIVRIGVLLVPVAVAEDEGPLLRRAWQLSRHSFWSLALMALTFAVVGLGLETAAEFVLRAIGVVPAIPSGLPLADLVVAYRAALLGTVVAVSLASLAASILVTAAASAAWRQLAGAQAGS